LISVIGSSPGVGKSTLCRALADWLAGVGVSVDHFEGAEVLTRRRLTELLRLPTRP
jgi:adenylate kinase family enzyme